ncbi:MAG: sigma-54 interaction domain-containing protein [Desulfohalobiaceae bacterium]
MTNMDIIPQIHDLFNFPVSLKKMLDEIPLSIVILDNHRKIIFINKAFSALTGYSLQEAYGIACHNIIRSQICIKECPIPHLSQESEPACVQTDIINRNRELIPTRITFAPLVDASGSLTGHLETIEDIRALQYRTNGNSQAFGFSGIIGKSPQMEKVFQMLPLIAQNDSSVMITGETGTGKDLVAEAIHEASNRAKGPFVKINCGALPESLLESELFGHQKGAFTGAVENKPGRFRLAHNGTLYLTEIADLPFALQVKLLTFLDDRIIYPLGSTKGFEVNVRVIAGTHQDLEHMVQNGTFRKDLLFRLNVVRMKLPPLRDRVDDIHLLIDHFLNIFSDDFDKHIKGLSQDTLQLLKSYTYPGNVRELRNIIEYCVNVCQGEYIEVQDLPSYLLEFPETHKNFHENISQNTTQTSEFETDTSKEMQPLATWAETEKQMILNALIKAGGKRQKAAEILGWGRSTLWRKIKQYEID